jgi:hypothetical protein
MDRELLSSRCRAPGEKAGLVLAEPSFEEVEDELVVDVRVEVVDSIGVFSVVVLKEGKGRGKDVNVRMGRMMDQMAGGQEGEGKGRLTWTSR